MKKLMFAIVMVAALEGFASFSYQGALRLADGSPVTDRTRTIEFRLYDGPGDDAQMLWAGQQLVVVSPSNGLFNVEIGDEMPSVNNKAHPAIDDILATYKDLYIGLEVDGSSGEIRPRQKILPVPTASFARDVRKTRGEFTVSSNLFVNGSAQVDGNVIVSGKIRSGESKSEVLPVPVGGIIMWSQKLPPDGEENWAANNNDYHWAICDGTTVNGVQTPNLVDRFVVGTTPKGFFNKYQLGDTGGTNEVTLSVGQMPSHNHRINGVKGGKSIGGGSSGYRNNFMEAHYQDGWDVDPDKIIEFKGGGAPHENRPPYYALYYIMRVR